MKNSSLVLNIVLLIAVIVLYVLHFSGKKSGTSSFDADDTTKVNLEIAYITSDSVLKYYEYLKVNKERLEAKTKQMDQDYRNRAIGLQGEINAYQRNVNSMTLGQVRATEEDLAKKQQNLQMYQQSLTQQLMEEEAKLNKELYDRVTAFLKVYAQEKNLRVVLKYDPTSDLLYGNRALDITQDVIKGLNEEYANEKNPSTKTSSDSASKK
jgi:outer membrane protein